MDRRLRIGLTILWTLLSGAAAAYALLKASPTSQDFMFLPDQWAEWLEQNYDVRTLLMSLAVLLPGAVLLGKRAFRTQRWIYVTLVTGVLLALELTQLWLPTRGFGLPDLLYTFVGGILAEATGQSAQTIDENF